MFGRKKIRELEAEREILRAGEVILEKEIKRLHGVVSELNELHMKATTNPLPEKFKTKLKHIWTDNHGRKFFEWKHPAEAPVQRDFIASRFLEEAYRGVTASDMKKYLDKIRSHFNSGDITKGIHAFEVMAEQAEMGADEEALWQLASVWFIREDEDPATFDQEISRDKVRTWKADKEAAAFFLPRAYKLIYDYGDTSNERITTYIREIAETTKKRKKSIGIR